jgi:hypothetical protein
MRGTGRGCMACRAVARACVAAALAGLMFSGCGSARPTSTVPTVPVPGSTVPASAIPRLRVIAERLLRMDAHGAPAWVSVVTTTRQKALTSATPGDLIPGSGKTIVYLLTMKGRFTDYAASVPAGASPPTGRYLSDVIDAQTFQGLDFGLGPSAPPVAPASLGPVTYLTGLGDPRQ